MTTTTTETAPTVAASVRQLAHEIDSLADVVVLDADGEPTGEELDLSTRVVAIITAAQQGRGDLEGGVCVRPVRGTLARLEADIETAIGVAVGPDGDRDEVWTLACSGRIG